MTSFTGTQLSAGQVSFVHNGSETSTASFQVAVEDGNEDGSAPVAQTFNLTVTAVNDRAGSDRRSRGHGERGRQLHALPASTSATPILTTSIRGVTFTVSSPVNGAVRVDGVAVTSFHRHAAQRPARSASCTMARETIDRLLRGCRRGRQRGRLGAGGADLQSDGDARSTPRRF